MIQLISKNSEIIQRGHIICIEPRKNISQVRTQGFSQAGHDFAIWRFWFLISHNSFYKNYRKDQKLQDARNVLIYTHFLTFETQPRVWAVTKPPPQIGRAHV